MGILGSDTGPLGSFRTMKFRCQEQQLCPGGPPADGFIAVSLRDVKFPDLDPAKQPTGKRPRKGHQRNLRIGKNELKALCRNLLLHKARIQWSQEATAD